MAARDDLEILREALPIERHSRGHNNTRNLLHPLHEPHSNFAVGRPPRRESHAAIAHDDRGDPVTRGRRKRVLPSYLPAVLSMDADDPRLHDGPGTAIL